MDCPKCMGVLEINDFPISPILRIEVDTCPLCKGFWFNGGELRKILKSKHGIVDEADWSSLPRTLELDSKAGNCPRCKIIMVRVPSLQDRRINLDYCANCDGFWVDGGEMEQLEKGGYVKRTIFGIHRFLVNIGRANRQAQNTWFPPGYEQDND